MKRKQLGRTLYIRVALIPLPIGIFAELTARANIDVGVSACVNLFDSHAIINLTEFKCANCKTCLFSR